MKKDDRAVHLHEAIAPSGAVVVDDEADNADPAVCMLCGGPVRLCGGSRRCTSHHLNPMERRWITPIRLVYAGLCLTPTAAALWGGALLRLARLLTRGTHSLACSATAHRSVIPACSTTGEAEPESAEGLDEPSPACQGRALAPARGGDPDRTSSGARADLLPTVRLEVADREWFSRLYEQAATAASTRRLYLNRFMLFLSWCATRGICALPATPEIVRLYLISLAEERKTISTLDVSLAAIGMAHRTLGYDPPMSEGLRETLRSLRATLTARSRPLTPISLPILQQIVTRCGQDPIAVRDRALILVSYFTGLRRFETASLDREDAHREEHGYRLTLGSKESDPGEDSTETPPRLAPHAEPNLCPVRALDGWLVVRAMWARGAELSPVRGPLFVALHRGRRQRFRLGARLAPGDMDRIVKRRAAGAGLDPAGLSAASLRAGFYNEVAQRGAAPNAVHAHVGIDTTTRELRAAEEPAIAQPRRSPT